MLLLLICAVVLLHRCAPAPAAPAAPAAQGGVLQCALTATSCLWVRPLLC